jgi:serine phosphatase RsbU (regulator of sigma subunit)
LADVSRDEELLKEKALLLLSREREILSLRRRHARVLGWLSVAQTLPELILLGRTPDAFFAEISRKLLGTLQFQRAYFFEISDDGTLNPRVRAAPRGGRLGPTSRQLVEERPVGICNAPIDDALSELARAVGLHRFLWQRVTLGQGRGRVLVVAGYDREKASFYETFEDDDVVHFMNMGQHLSALLSNVSLVKELERDKQMLQQFNETLEQRVRERTEELGTTNGELARTVASLQDKDRRLREDLEQARSFQQSILPKVPPSMRVEFGATYLPLELVGGDVYDVYAVTDGQFRCFMADATGHGVQASLRTIVLKSEYDRTKGVIADPEGVLEHLNRRLTLEYGAEEMLCTACCFDLILTDDGARIRYANCAQPPLLRASGQSVQEIYSSGPFLGLSDSIRVPVVETTIERGDLLLAHSDGLCDQINASGASFAPAPTLIAASRNQASAERVLGSVMRDLDEFRGATAIADDITMLAARLL